MIIAREKERERERQRERETEKAIGFFSDKNKRSFV
jgi:hypothetical protein